jgi:hypothetical protein
MNEHLGQDALVRQTSITREQIAECEDLATLNAWFLETDERELHIRSFLDAFRAAQVDDESWFKRAGGALAWSKITKVFIERRILALGGEPPYQPTDPRAKALRSANDQIDKLKKRVAELERDAAREQVNG